MSIISITLAYVLGIKWGLYQDVKILVGLLIFLLICTLIFNKDKFNMIIILCVLCTCGFAYSKTKFNRMNVSYIENEYKNNHDQMLFFMLTNILDKSTELLCYGKGTETLIRTAYGIELQNHSCLLENLISRKKQLLPQLMYSLQT